jgi:2,3-bisphosphoglycerate-dependent phosphoglycerate mutase
LSYRLVLLRHGQSTWNADGRFTGWVDAPLSDLGREEARSAGQVLDQASVRPDVVHTSLLTRAIETAQIALAEMDLAWLPVRRSWRLNERHYGALQGLDKVETAAKHGEEQVKVWRRSYDIRPPAQAPNLTAELAADPRYADLAPDLLPSAECLKDVVERMLPYWYDAIVPDLRAHGCVLVSAHGNSLRALVKHLDQISDRDIVDLNIPTGVPRVYDLGPDLQVLSASYLGDPARIAAKAEAVAREATQARS